MPALSSSLAWTTVAARNATQQTAQAGLTTIATNSTRHLEIVCAWPVSGQYGPGSRLLYYVLVAACIFARKAEWLRSACLAAALLFPAVAALHGIVLAAVHNDAAVDMDVYGALQLCSIGILAAPVTVRLSRTYFDNPGRNTIFVWALLVLAGLLSLTIEFYRISTSTCSADQPGSSLDISNSMIDLLNEPPTCGLVCSVDNPVSPLRGGSANNIYIIPVPTRFSFSTATLLAAACCIPTVLLLVSLWLQVMEISWKSRFGTEDGIGRKKEVGKVVRLLRKFFEIPLFAAAVIALLIVGERNLFSIQVQYQTEPMANVGQWAPIVGVALGLLGSFYLVLAEAVEEEAEKRAIARGVNVSRRGSLVPGLLYDRRGSVPAPAEPMTDMVNNTAKGIVHLLARGILTLRDRFSPGRKLFDESEFQRGRATNDFPEVPGEEQRNRDLSRIRTQYSQNRDSSGEDESGLRRERSGTISSTYSMGRPSLAIESPPQTPTAVALPRRRSTLEPPVETFGLGRSLSHPPITPPPAAVIESSEAPAIVISSSPDRTPSPRARSPSG